MGCTAVSRFSENVRVRKGDFELKVSRDAIFERLCKELEKRHLNGRFKLLKQDYIEKWQIFEYIKMRFHQNGQAFDDSFDRTYNDNKLVPDGGIIWLQDNLTMHMYPILVSEMKYQGTNNGRKELDLDKQAVGNAIERLGKYATAMRNFYKLDDIFPFVTFCAGCDFQFDAQTNMPITPDSKIIGSKLNDINCFRVFNKVYLYTNIPRCYDKPFTLMTKDTFWTTDEMNRILWDVALDSLNYYLKIALEENSVVNFDVNVF